MNDLILILVSIGLGIACVFCFVAMVKAKAQIKREEKTWAEERKKMLEAMNEQKRIINNMETGDSLTDFNNSLDVLHKYANKKR